MLHIKFNLNKGGEYLCIDVNLRNVFNFGTLTIDLNINFEAIQCNRGSMPSIQAILRELFISLGKQD